MKEYEVVFQTTKYETYYVKADDEDDAEMKARGRNFCDSPDKETSEEGEIMVSEK